MSRAALLLAFAMPFAAHAQAPGNVPRDAAVLAWTMHPGAQVPAGTMLRDEAGRPVQLGEMFGPTPIILDLGYFHCPSLCGVVRADLFAAIAGSNLQDGRDYTLVSLSIDPAETAADATAAKAKDLPQARPGGGRAWHYLTGTAEALDVVERSIGFHEQYDGRFRQFMHPAGLVVLTGEGQVSSYLLGVGFQAGDLRAAVLRAGQGGIATATLPILLLCFHYDPTTGRYTLAIEKLLRMMAALTVVTVGAGLVVLHRQRPGAPS